MMRRKTATQAGSKKESEATNLYFNRAASGQSQTTATGTRRNNDAAIRIGTPLAMKGFARCMKETR
jgi:hypothetical protein